VRGEITSESLPSRPVVRSSIGSGGCIGISHLSLGIWIYSVQTTNRLNKPYNLNKNYIQMLIKPSSATHFWKCRFTEILCVKLLSHKLQQYGLTAKCVS